MPPPPFTRGELEADAFPERAYTREELLPAAELLLYNLRHVQHHVAQLNLLIRQTGAEPARWIMRSDERG